MNDAGPQLTRWQTIMLQAVFPILLIGILLPLGLTVLVLGVDQVSLSHAFDHGELYLVGANAAFTSCLVLISNRPDQAINTFIISSFISSTVVFPSYFVWALLSTAPARAAQYSTNLKVTWGIVAAVAGLVTALGLVVYAFFIPASASGGVSGQGSATLGGVTERKSSR